MAEAKHVEKPSARVKMPEAEAAPQENPLVGWTPMPPPFPLEIGQAPFDGKAVQVLAVMKDDRYPDRPGYLLQEAVFRVSRRRAQGKLAWESYVYWAVHNGGGTPLRFVPTHWRAMSLIPLGA